MAERFPADLLDGLAGDARRERAELIVWLLDRGFTVEEIRRSHVPLVLAANRVMGEDGHYVSQRQVAQSAGIDLDTLRRLQRAMGLPLIDDPDAAVLRRVDAEAAASAKYFLDFGLDLDDAVAVVRALVEGIGNATATLRDKSFNVWVKPGASEVDIAAAAEALAGASARRIEAIAGRLMLMQMRRMIESEGIGAVERASGRLPGAQTVAVAFADLSGFTQLGEVLTPDELAKVAGNLSDLAHEVVDEPVRFIKTIGDAVMLVSPDPGPLIEVVLNLIDAALHSGLPQLRAGVALGPAVNRAGDWFGSAVNLASRVAGIAPAGMALVTAAARDRVAGEGLQWTSTGPHQLRGLPDAVELYRVGRVVPAGFRPPSSIPRPVSGTG
ncbi:adenylate/guanylate cyclase domain-containing protein [Mycolicibacterium brumae]|uniref:Adenylate/guanylate cyclase domain-containing protein n=1 Tax=Mycolicibacterium brumae TaxID=85968 RepID=A0A2G5P4D2_9MYCO|nr:adenylate/guanylate cyclase domain-containing protein [Mycolicibacterium brumae]MCV7191274.1 adenylate/guanylate cyclase domain-containing protein [Mycolicibacterium brumae]PIB73222.1 adenylate/guanylate cyclase domain-containing protein [Mycolicibacterium brumae]RWA17822.1 hypothetical protein MBRU_18480 [Mycolicibacterium brumae DSM 44177]UWW09727.1 adenylate/guanylate cyclase domain-containing protein [Mycolicibacterium brumae]